MARQLRDGVRLLCAPDRFAFLGLTECNAICHHPTRWLSIMRRGHFTRVYPAICEVVDGSAVSPFAELRHWVRTSSVVVNWSLPVF
jgi:hypothetical protein